MTGRRALVHAVAPALVLALTAPQPAIAAEVEVKASDALAWEPALVAIAPGDTVRWTFAGTTGLHNVRSGSDNWTLQSPAGAPAPDATSTFAETGTYRFFCEVHPDAMVGEVVVATVPPPPPPPPPLSEQPFGNDGGELTVLETGAYDDVRPALAAVTVRRAGPGVRVAFRVSEPSRVTARFVRRGRTVRTIRVRAAGRAAITARTGLRPGRYRIDLRAEDAAGNRSRVRRLRVTVR